MLSSLMKIQLSKLSQKDSKLKFYCASIVD